jgi:hypothetical protein
MDTINKKLTEALEGVLCRHCGGGPIVVENRFEAKDIGEFSLAGVQMKFSGGFWPWAKCLNCGHQSRGQVEA